MRENVVKISNPREKGRLGTRVEIGGHEICNIRSVDFHVSVEEIPTFVLETMGMPDIEMNGHVCFEFTPKTVQEAAGVICKEFTEGSEGFKAMVASVRNVLNERSESVVGECAEELSEAITNRIIGIEEPPRNERIIGENRSKYVETGTAL